MVKHALLGASSAKRWLTCTPSPRLEEQFKESKSVYAEEGTYAHLYGELLLKKATGLIKRGFKVEQDTLRISPFFSDELEDYIQSYVDTVMSFFNEAKSKYADPIVMLEQKLDYSVYAPGGFGTGDVIIVSDGELHIIDLKYGAGIKVYAEGNPQLRLYAIGALLAFGFLYDIDTVKMTIIQPRLDHVDTEILSRNELENWATNYVKPRAEMAFAGIGEFVAGDHCQFCKAKATCKHRADYNLEIIKYEFKECDLLTDEEIGRILLRVEQLLSWVKDVQNYAYNKAVNEGKRWEGWKLVEGRSTRKYTDPEAIKQLLLKDGYAQNKILTEPELKGITALQQILGKKVFDTKLKDYIIKPEGKPALVPETDKRPEFRSKENLIELFGTNLIPDEYNPLTQMNNELYFDDEELLG